LDTRGVGVLHSVERLLADIYIPALSKSSNWGELSDKHGSGVRQGFMNQLENFVGKLMIITIISFGRVLKKIKFLHVTMYM